MYVYIYRYIFATVPQGTKWRILKLLSRNSPQSISIFPRSPGATPPAAEEMVQKARALWCLWGQGLKTLTLSAWPFLLRHKKTVCKPLETYPPKGVPPIAFRRSLFPTQWGTARAVWPLFKSRSQKITTWKHWDTIVHTDEVTIWMLKCSYFLTTCFDPLKSRFHCSYQ